MRFKNEYTIREIAKWLGIKPKAVHARIRRRGINRDRIATDAAGLYRLLTRQQWESITTPEDPPLPWVRR